MQVEDPVQIIVESLGKKRAYQSGVAIFEQGRTPEYVGFLNSGSAKAVAITNQGQETWLQNYDRGDFIAHHVSAPTDEFPFSVLATKDSEVTLIEKKIFEDLTITHPVITRAVFETLSAQLEDMTTRLLEAATLSAPGRVCAELHRRAKPIGIRPEHSIIRPCPIFLELAQQISSTRETVSRTINGLISDNIVAREPGALVILHVSKLQQRIM